MHLPLLATLTATLALTAIPAMAQRQTTPEQRIDRLEKQVRQMSRQVFPKGQPADTSGFSDEPAASLTQANQLSSRLDSIGYSAFDVDRHVWRDGTNKPASCL